MLSILQTGCSADNRGVGNDEMHCIAARVAESDSGEPRMNRGIGNDDMHGKAARPDFRVGGMRGRTIAESDSGEPRMNRGIDASPARTEVHAESSQTFS
ncbi:MAG: hypothetical protein DME49_00160 [Verrucomicrobia bacterium]|nr:MAG: hypothetical protein DME49_00160 [Verrucomicrobiota bacterium]